MREVMMQLHFVEAQTRALTLVLVLLSCSESVHGANPLYVSMITSFGEFGFNASGVIPAIDLALEHINARPDLLPGYELGYLTLQDSGCERKRSLQAFFREVNSGPDRIAIVGCGCAVATEPVAEISHFWNISQIASSSGSSTLSDRSRFRNFFRTNPTFENFAPGLLSTFQYYGWRSVQFLTQKENLFTDILIDVTALTKNSTVCCFNQVNYTFGSWEFETGDNPIPAIAESLDPNSDNRIFFVNGYSGPARQIICEAYKRKLTYPRYVWLTHGWYPDRWWTQQVTNNTVNCTEEQLEEFLVENRVLILNHLTMPEDGSKTTNAGIKPDDYQVQYENRTSSENYYVNTHADAAYDAMWALAFALNRTAAMIDSGDINETGCGGKFDGALVSLHLFNYSNALLGCVIKWSLLQTNFIGVSGNVSFKNGGDRAHSSIRIEQYRRTGDGEDLKACTYAHTSPETNFTLTYMDGENNETIFPDGIPPDGTPIKIIDTHNTGLIATYYTLATIGIVFAAVCIAFNCIFRNRRIIKLTSPNLNYLIVGGALLMYASVYIQLLPTASPSVIYTECIIHSWLYFPGYLLAFGTTLAKMWRVYHIFKDPSPKKKKMNDWHLVLIALVITGVGSILLIFRSAFQPNPPTLVADDEQGEGRTTLGVRVVFCVFKCYAIGDGAFYCDVFIFVYLGVLQIVGIIIAFQTRNVHITVLNESKFVAALVYFSSIVFVALVIVTFALGSRINVSGGIFSGGILLLATLALAVTFIPKMVFLYQDPNGDKVFGTKNTSINNAPDNAGSGSQVGDVQLSTLTSIENRKEKEELERKLEETIKERDRAIADLQNSIAIPTVMT